MKKTFRKPLPEFVAFSTRFSSLLGSLLEQFRNVFGLLWPLGGVWNWLGRALGHDFAKKIALEAHFGRLGGHLGRPEGHFGPNCWIWNGFGEDFG